ncbi:MAG: hypothetical protein GY792_04140 [Gammaproteobacteria bacterium]|nr:hypothetical protein [Gammaproteobacteria bacterium]
MTQELMIEFARCTGLSPAAEIPRRYLWTDSFAVCNYLGLYGDTGDQRYRDLALDLVDQVHRTLGRHREDDPRSGWISGLGEQKGERHPTIGGLRIGKAMNECGPGDPYEEVLEWERDGQYFHYLTKWMHALNRVSRVTGDPIYNRWAAELAKTAHTRFTYTPSFGARKRMYWKMSIDLSRPLVPSMGQQDPLDGYIACNRLQHCRPGGEAETAGPDLLGEITELAEICRGQSWVTDDSLGIGGLLCDAWTVAQMTVNCGFSQPELLENLLDASLAGVQSFSQTDALHLPATYRLPFREFGLSIGLRAVQRLQGSMQQQPGRLENHQRLHETVGILMGYLPLVKDIEAFWLDPLNQKAETWTGHLDINTVMLATNLSPDGFLTV